MVSRQIFQLCPRATPLCGSVWSADQKLYVHLTLPFSSMEPASSVVAPSEPNIRLLTDMGFSRERAVNALRRTNDNVESATTYLLQEPQ